MRGFIALAAALAVAAPVAAQDIKLPATLTATAYDTGSSGFNIAVAVGKVLKDKHGTDVRVLPAGNDVARLSAAARQPRAVLGHGHRRALRAGGACSSSASRTGARSSCGIMLASTDCNASGLGVAKDTGAKEIKDLKGKRLGVVVGSPALNQNALRHPRLRRPDAQRCEARGVLQLRREVEGHAQQRGRRRGRLDTSRARPRRSRPRRAAWSIRRCRTTTRPAGRDCNKIGPYFLKHKATCGAGLPSNPAELPTIPIRSSWPTTRSRPS